MSKNTKIKMTSCQMIDLNIFNVTNQIKYIYYFLFTIFVQIVNIFVSMVKSLFHIDIKNYVNNRR